ncbi:MAG: hypothetical protein A2075_06170 [Geobacteraceae bacterium GWC2_58_44]|nr:MAG: hypothetical protein A2075_06170 [Geobacteraceae bacterium GWC2_58_44]HBG05749.1 hypothetical protein [Geobacter sp.]
MLQLPDVQSRFNGMLLLMAVAPLLYFASIFAFSVNVPVGDDYSMLGFLNEFRGASGVENKLKYLFSFHNEHRIVLTRAIMLLCTSVMGALDFRVMNLIGNFALLFTLLVIGGMLRLRDDRLKWALLFLIVLQPQPLKLMFYPMAGVQAYFGLLFSFLYLHFSLKDSNSWYAALLFYLLTVLTTGSGIFLAVLGIPILLYKKCYLRSAIHAAVALLAVILYSPSSSNLPYLIDHPWTVVQFFLLLLGSVAQLPMLGSSFLQIVCSIALLGYFAYSTWDGFYGASRRVQKENLATLCCLLYLLMIVALIAVGRASLYQGDLWGASLDGRYRIYSILFLAVCCVDLVGKLRNREKSSAQFTTAMVTVALLFNVVWFAPSIIQMRFASKGHVYAMQQWVSTGDITSLPIWSTPPEEAQANLVTAIKTGNYRP